MQTSLIIDPSPIVRKVASHLFLTEGMLAIDVATVAEGLEVARRYDPSIILVDSRVGDMDALAAVRRLRSLNPPKQPMILITTIENDPAIASQAIGAGANQILLKPYDRFSIREVLADRLPTAA